MPSNWTRVSLIVALTLTAGSARAQWPVGPDSCLGVYSSDTHRSALLSLAPDESGGAFLAWRTGGFAECPFYGDGVALQRVTASGQIAWNVTATEVTSNGTQPAIASDRRGGVIVVWKNNPHASEYAVGYDGLCAQRFDTTGTPLWGANVVVSNRPEEATQECQGWPNWPFPRNPVVVSAPDGGAFVTWQAGAAVRAQRITSAGEPAWGSDGKLIGYWGLSRTWANAVPDGSGGLIAVWSGQNHSLFAQRIDADGALRWGDSTSAIAIGPELNEYQQPAVVSDDSGGVIVAWTDHRDGFAAPGNIYAQRIDTIGRIRWSEDGILLCSRPRSQWIYANPAIVSDGQGGAIVAWGDSRGSCGIQFHSCQIFAQRITRAGTAAWAPNGVLMSGADDTLSDYTIEADEAGGATVAWTRWVDDRRANQIWAQRVASDGSLRWNETGRMIAATSPSRRLPQMLSDGFSGTIIAWESNDQPANVAGGSVEAQHISPASQLFSALSSSSILAAPNPTRGDAMLRLALSRPGPGTVAIHDLVGRRVRLVFEGELQGGDHSIAWDGRDDAGNRVRPGVYFARVTHPGTRAVGRIVLLP